MLDLARHQQLPEQPRYQVLGGPMTLRSRMGGWLEHVAIPYWLARGIDHQAGGFHECLSFSGQSLPVNKRLRTAARQTFCFASAIRYGWDESAECHAAVGHGIAFLNRHARQSNNTFAKEFTSDGRVINPSRDAYDYAFLLFAAAAAVRVGNLEARQLGEDVMHQLEADFYLGSGCGYREVADSKSGVDANGVRRANPHMHILEAFTAWHRATGDMNAHTRAADIVDMFLAKMFDSQTGSLREFMDADLQPLPDARADIREPGHAFEWAWLLYDFDRCGDARVQEVIKRLCTWAVTFGTNPATGLTHQRVTYSGRVLDDTSRSWPQTEAVRAMLALERIGHPDITTNASARLDTLFRHHLAPAPAGLWFDRIAADGTVLSESVPASILYHLVSVFTASLDVADL